MSPELADRLSIFLVRCHPRRWRDRYAQEMLDVLDQHQATARTVLSLWASAVSAQLDPAYRTEALSPTRLRRAALITAVTLGPIVLMAGWLIGNDAWKDSHWHVGVEGGVTSMAFSPADPHILVTATSGSMDGLDTLWDVTDPARPKDLAGFEGGGPTTFSPDSRTVATVAFSGQPALWNVANPRKPARITTVPSGDDHILWGEAFSPDGRILAAAYTDRIYLWDVTDLARPRLLRWLAAPVTPVGPPPAPVPFYTRDIGFSPDGLLLASAAGRDQVALWDVADPAHAARIATLPGRGGFVSALAFSPGGKLLAGVGYHGIVTMFSLADLRHPRLVASLPMLVGRQLVNPCDCTEAMYTLAFSPNGRTLTAIADHPVPTEVNAPPYGPAPTQYARDFGFTWNVAAVPSVSLLGSFSRNVAACNGNSSLPLIAPDGRTVASGAPFSSFGVTVRTLPQPPS